MFAGLHNKSPRCLTAQTTWYFVWEVTIVQFVTRSWIHEGMCKHNNCNLPNELSHGLNWVVTSIRLNINRFCCVLVLIISSSKRQLVETWWFSFFLICRRLLKMMMMMVRASWELNCNEKRKVTHKTIKLEFFGKMAYIVLCLFFLFRERAGF